MFKPSLRFPRSAYLALCVGMGPALLAADYHIDFEAGDDSRDGLTPATAFKRSPGDPEATALAAAVALKPGDRLLFKGGVIYRGGVTVTASGEAGKPIIIDGGAWGEGRAVIHGGTAVTGWKRCASIEEAKGNPRWADIFYADIPKPKSYKDLNLCDETAPLPIAQHPNPRDFYWQEHMHTFLSSPNLLRTVGGLRIAAEKGFKQDSKQPISNLLTGNLAVVSPIPGASFTYSLAAPAEITEIGVAVQQKYAALKDFSLRSGGKELGTFTLAKDDKGKLQRFTLPTPARVSTLTFSFTSMHAGESSQWSKLKQVAAYSADGTNLLKGSDNMTFADAENLDQLSGKRADWFDGMTFAFHGGNNHIIYLPIRGYDPATGTLTLPVMGEGQYKQTRYCLFNSVRLIDHAGEHSVEATEDPKVSRLFLLPRALVDGKPAAISMAARGNGILLTGANHVAIQNLTLRQQNGSALRATGPAKDITYRDCEVTQVRAGVAVSGTKIEGMLIERLDVHDNPGHTKGIVLHTCSSAMIRDSRAVRNTSTAIDYYVCSDSQVVGNTVLENLGSHANGLTFYVGCKNILVERNFVARGNVALTFQEGDGFIFRNNIFDGGLSSAVVGIWPAQPLRNVQFINNTIVRSNPNSQWAVGMFSNSRKIDGLVVKNNIIDGLFSDHDVFKNGTFSNNLYTRVAKDQEKGLLGSNELVETDLRKIFVDPDQGDFRLCPGSPAIGAGIEAGVEDDFTAKPRPADRSDIGAQAFR